MKIEITNVSIKPNHWKNYLLLINNYTKVSYMINYINKYTYIRIDGSGFSQWFGIETENEVNFEFPVVIELDAKNPAKTFNRLNKLMSLK